MATTITKECDGCGNVIKVPPNNAQGWGQLVLVVQGGGQARKDTCASCTTKLLTAIKTVIPSIVAPKPSKVSRRPTGG